MIAKRDRNGRWGRTERERSLEAQGRPGKEDTKINIKMEKAHAKFLYLYLTFLV